MESTSADQATWLLPNPLTAAAVERRLDTPPAPLTVVANRTLRAGPAADARLLSFLDRQRIAGAPTSSTMAYLLSRHPEAAHGWRQVIETVTLQLLGHYADRTLDFDGVDVTETVEQAQRQHLGRHGVVTVGGGQTAVIDRNDVLGAGQSKTLFAAPSTEQLQLELREFAGRRGTGTKSPVTPRLLTYLAEAIENVREHAVVSMGGSPNGLCLLQMKRINADQLPLIEKQLGDTSPFRGYLAGTRAHLGRRLTGLLELTVADTGAGIARTLIPDLRDDADAELDALLRAFTPGVTRKTTWGSGLGLSNMLEDLHAEHGALQVRTGRYSLFRSSLTPDGREAADEPSSRRYWTVSLLPHAPGTGVTLLVPTSR